jgi:hypothetical protein
MAPEASRLYLDTSMRRPVDSWFRFRLPKQHCGHASAESCLARRRVIVSCPKMMLIFLSRILGHTCSKSLSIYILNLVKRFSACSQFRLCVV